jgi:hypothetical protein
LDCPRAVIKLGIHVRECATSVNGKSKVAWAGHVIGILNKLMFAVLDALTA